MIWVEQVIPLFMLSKKKKNMHVCNMHGLVSKRNNNAPIREIVCYKKREYKAAISGWVWVACKAWFHPRLPSHGTHCAPWWTTPWRPTQDQTHVWIPWIPLSSPPSSVVLIDYSELNISIFGDNHSISWNQRSSKYWDLIWIDFSIFGFKVFHFWKRIWTFPG